MLYTCRCHTHTMKEITDDVTFDSDLSLYLYVVMGKFLLQSNHAQTIDSCDAPCGHEMTPFMDEYGLADEVTRLHDYSSLGVSQKMPSRESSMNAF